VIRWGVRNGLLAHAIPPRPEWLTADAALCGAARGYFRSVTPRDVKCIRCLRALGKSGPRALVKKVSRVNSKQRTLRDRLRKVMS
jgi:hypothetical protein